MEPTPHNATGHQRSNASVASCVEGYLALALTAWLFLVPSYYLPSHPVIAAVIIGVAFGLALGGVRFAKGGGRVAAQVALAVLSFWLLAILAASILRSEQVLWYWRQ